MRTHPLCSLAPLVSPLVRCSHSLSFVIRCALLPPALHTRLAYTQEFASYTLSSFTVVSAPLPFFIFSFLPLPSTMSVANPPSLSPAPDSGAAALAERLAKMEGAIIALSKSSGSRNERPKPPPMEQFTGKFDSFGFAVDSWIRLAEKQFEHYGAAVFPDETSKIAHAVKWLKDAAQDWWDHLDKTDAHTWTWADFVERLRDRYRPQMPAELARQRLRTLRQRGRVHTYCEEFLRIVQRIPGRTEEDKIFDFKEGLDKPLAAKVAESKPATLHEAMEIAVRAEPYVSSFRAGTGSGTNASTFRTSFSSSSSSSASSGAVPMEVSNVEESAASNHDPVQMLLAKMEMLESKINAVSSRPAPRASARVPDKLFHEEIERLKAEGRCFRCKQKGHMKSDCPQVRAAQPLNK